MAPFRWNAKRERAAVLVAEDERSNAEIGAALGVTRRSIDYWKAHPEFAARVTQLVDETREAVRQQVVTTGIADRVNRVRRLNEDWERKKQIIQARAAEMTGADGEEEAPGVGTGLLVRQRKMLGGGQFGYEVTEYVFDAALDAALRADEKQAAQELGEWTERTIQEHMGSIKQVHEYPDLDTLRALPAEDLVRLHRETLGLSQEDR